MTEKFGSAYTDLKWELRGPASRLMKEFESYKRDFGKSDDDSMYAELPLALKGVPDSAWYNEMENIINVFPADFIEMFKPVVQKILDLVESQFDDERRQTGHNTIKVSLQIFCGPAMLTPLCRLRSLLEVLEILPTSIIRCAPGCSLVA